MEKPILRIVLFAVLLLSGCYANLSAQNTATGFDPIAAAFKKGDAASIAKHFDGNVVITFKTGGTPYSKSQAEIVLKNFFTGHVPKTFSVVHEGTSPEGSKYFIGTLNTGTGNYKTYVHAKMSNNVLIIQEIRFEEAQ